MNQENRDTAQ